MNTNAGTLLSFIDKIKSISLFQRLFQWKAVRNQLVDAAAALSRLLGSLENLQLEKTELANQLSHGRKDLELTREQKTRLEAAQKRSEELLSEKENTLYVLNKELTTQTANARNLENQVLALSNELAALKEKIRHSEQALRETTEECIELRQKEEGRSAEHDKAVATLNAITERLQAEREKETADRHQQELERLHQLKETWMNHQATVRKTLKSLCHKHTIDYLEQAPFKGEPDNTISLCDEYIVFDAKSPAGDDTSHFSAYLKDQAEKARKYAKQEGVKTDIFFVVPSNTLEAVKQNSFHLADFNVYVISADCLEPVLLCLKKIEAYEFAQQLSPEERENICRILGQFAHLTKRRIQIDSFFARQFIELVYKCESNLPEDILEKVAEFERSEKLNPPMEKRAKAINTKQLELDVSKLEMEVRSKGIAVEDVSAELNGVRLYGE